jgi:hypothetical protein
MRTSGDSVMALTLDARALLGHGQAGLGALLGSSRRTVQRWDAGRGRQTGPQLAKLAAAVFPRDADLAQKLARNAGTTLEGLGLVPPASSASGVGKPNPLVDSVVCAAAEALGTAPPAVRPVLLAAFRRAREVGLTLEDVERAISDALGEGKSKAAT